MKKIFKFKGLYDGYIVDHPSPLKAEIPMYNIPSYVNIKEFFCKNMRIPSFLQIVEQKMSHNEKLRKSF